MKKGYKQVIGLGSCKTYCSAIDRTGSNFKDTGIKLRKIRKLIETSTYDTDISRYIPGTLDLIFQGMLEDIYMKEQPTHFWCRSMKSLNFQILLTNIYYTNPKSMHLGFPMKIKN